MDMQSSPDPLAPDRPAPIPLAQLGPLLLEILSLCGYGLWMLLGLALALGIYSPGRGPALVPLTLGGLFVSAGLVAACLRLRAFPQWHGWRIGRSQWPTGEALLALATYLPMLGLGGLVRGDGDFWATRLISVLLALGSSICLISSVYGYRKRRCADRGGVAAQLPVSRMLSACYGGGLWLWVCLLFQAEPFVPPENAWPWTIGLLLLAMLLGLVEGMAWQSLRGDGPDPWLRCAQQGLQSRRFLAATLSFALPCLSLLLVPLAPAARWLAPVAAAAYVVGAALETWLHDSALARMAPARRGEPASGLSEGP
jgi:hypothetical protein